LLGWGFGIDENGDLSVGGFLLLLLSIIPIGRIASIAGKALSRILSKAGLKVGVNLAENWLIRKFGNFLSDLTHKFGLKNLETWKNAISWIGNVLLPNPVGWATDILKGLAKLTGNEKLIAAATAFSNFQFRRGLGDFGDLLVSPDPVRKIGNVYGEVGGFLNRNLNYLIDSSKKFVNGAVNTVKSVGNIVNKISTTVKQLIPKAVTTVKKAVNKVVTNVKTAAKKAVNTAKQIVTTAKKVVNKTVNTAKKVVKKAVNTAKKVVNKAVTKAVNTVKRTAKKAVNTAKKVVKKVKTVAKKVVSTAKKVVKKVKTVAKKAVNTVKKAASSAVNWVKSKIRWPW
jgi:vacuolar-type H+-ATPase subunit H